MAMSLLQAKPPKKRWHRRRARHALRPMRPTGIRLHAVTWLAALAVIASLWVQYSYVGFGRWIGPKIAPPSLQRASVAGPSPSSRSDVIRGTYLVNGRHGDFWPVPVSKAAVVAGTIVVPYEDHPFVKGMVLTAAGLLVVSTLFAVEQWARTRFRITIMSLLILTTVSSIAFSAYLPYEGSIGLLLVRLPMLLAFGVCPLAWLLTTRAVMRKMSAIA